MRSTGKIVLGAGSLGLMLAALYMALVYAPTEADSGDVQRIFYFHVPCAWVAFASFGLVAIAGAFYLWMGDSVWDDLGYAAAEIGMLFCTLVLITGSIWAKPIWGVWWTWDSRLTTTLILWLMYAGYVLLRTIADDTPIVARLAAVVGIVAAIDVPIVIVSVRLWRTIHPAILVTREGTHGLDDPRMLTALFVSLAAFTILYAWLLWLRFSTLRMRARLRELRFTLADLAAS